MYLYKGPVFAFSVASPLVLESCHKVPLSLLFSRIKKLSSLSLTKYSVFFQHLGHLGHLTRLTQAYEHLSYTGGPQTGGTIPESVLGKRE